MRIYATCLGDAAQRLSLHDEKERNWMCSLCVPLRSKQRNFFSRFRFCHHFVLIDACSEVWLCVASILFASCHHGLGVKAHGESDRECIAANIVGNGRDKKCKNGMACALAYRESNRIIIWGIQFENVNEMLCSFVSPKIMFPLIAFA